MKNNTSFKSGKDHKNWKGGSYITDKGYRKISVGGKYVLEHIFLIEQRIGRKITKEEVVHHIDENPLNNSIKNLSLMTRSEHSRIHRVGVVAAIETKEKLKKLKSGTHQKQAHNQWRDSVTLDDILVLLSNGYSKKMVAKKLGIHPDTLRNRMYYYISEINKYYKRSNV